MSKCRSVLLACVGVAPLAVLSPLPALAQPVEPAPWPLGPPPRLTVVLSIDQFRGDYLYRFHDLFLPAKDGETLGGFSYLMTRGAYFASAKYEHYPLFTGPGHAVILTGAHPYKSGIVGNEWWDTRERHSVYCVDDPRFEVVGAGPGSRARPMGPGNLQATTVGDELKLATAGRARAVSLAIKDRAAILLGGHAPDLSMWFDTAGGRWISSTAFCRDGQLPDWVDRLNKDAIPARALGTDWEAISSAETLGDRASPPAHVGTDVPKGFGDAFPHHIGSEPTAANFHAFCFTPAANDFVFASAERAIEAEQMGQDETPDLLSINLSPNDYIGHAFGPYSPEVLEMTLATDRGLSGFLNYLSTHVPGGMDSVLFVLTADHGVSPIPEEVAGQPLDFSAERLQIADVLSTIADALTGRFGKATGGSWFATAPEDPEGKNLAKSGAYLDGSVYLNPNSIAEAIGRGAARSRREIEQAACDAVNASALPGVYACYGKTQILEGAVGDTDLARHLAKGVHPRLSPDLIIIPRQDCLENPPSAGHATTHGTPYAYDTHVPVILCYPPVLRAGVYCNQAAPSDIAPTVSLLLGVEFPSGCDGRVLDEAIRSQTP
ncbi:MAG: alkaline phosphatase family protein [Phycisphaerales bacterium]|nr:alkaline phosphatase family protein [Phycisphaerales bacterium]